MPQIIEGYVTLDCFCNDVGDCKHSPNWVYLKKLYITEQFHPRRWERWKKVSRGVRVVTKNSTWEEPCKRRRCNKQVDYNLMHVQSGTKTHLCVCVCMRACVCMCSLIIIAMALRDIASGKKYLLRKNSCYACEAGGLQDMEVHCKRNTVERPVRKWWERFPNQR